MKHSSFLSLLITSLVVIALTLLYACEDNLSVQDTPPQPDNQISAPSPQNAQAKFDSEGFDIIEGEYIVIFKNQFDSVFSDQVARKVDQVRQEVQSRHQIKDETILSRWRRTTKGFAAKLDSSQVNNLKNDPLVASVTPNIYGRIGISNSTLYESKKEENLNENAQAGGQILPWGVERVRGPYDGTGKRAWILDTGIDFNHPDLNVDVTSSNSFIAGEDANDLNGHGTHVAGILAAIDNDIDVVGVAAGATVIPVKVCNQFGDCPKNSFLDGIEYVTENANPHDIVNVSLWWPADSDIDNAVISAASHSIPFTLIAGNNGGNANNYSPGRATHYNIKTISAFDEDDIFAPFSNFGNPPINFSSPGVDILSTSVANGIVLRVGKLVCVPEHPWLHLI